MNVRLYVWQRLTAALMVPLVVVHVAVIFYATRKGMTAADNSRAHARQHRLGVVLRRLRRCRRHPCGDRRAQRVDRMVAA